MILSTYKKTTRWIFLGALAVALVLVGYGVTLVDRVQQARSSWDASIHDAGHVMHRLHEMQALLGYGGFIDEYRQFQRDRETRHVPRLLDQLAEIDGLLADAHHAHSAAGDAAAAHALQDAIKHYRRNIKLISEGREEEIAPAVEEAAVRGLAVLSRHAMREGEGRRDDAKAALNEAVTLLYGGLVLVVLVFLVALVLVHDRRRLARASLKAEAARLYLDSLLEATPDAMLTIDAQGHLREANLAAERLFGYAREKLLQMTVEDLIPERFRTAHREMRDNAYSKDHARPFMIGADFFIKTSGGYELPVDISLSYSRQPEGKLVLVSLRDISERKELEHLLRERQEDLKTAQSIAHIGSWVWMIQPDEFSWSDEMYRIFGLVPGTLRPTYSAFMERIHPEDRVRVGATVAQVLVDDQPYEIEHRVVRPNGEQRIVLEKGRLFRDQDCEPLRMVGTIWDITERKEAERELLFDRAIIDGISQPVVVVDQRGCIEDLNPAYCEMSGYSRDELLGRPSNVLKSGRHDQVYYRGLWDALQNEKKWQGEIWIRRKDGVIVPRLLSITTICEPELNQCRYVGFYSDISSLKESEAKLEKLAHFDQLTGLANRMLFHDRLRAAIARARRSESHVGVLFVDLDGFKQVNDTLGHRTGDMLLVEMAERMKVCVREDDTVARLGGDEFALVLNELEERSDVSELAQRLLDNLRVSLGAGAETLRVSASIGIALYPEHGSTVTLLLEKADQAMYQAKQAGKDSYAVYTADAEAAPPKRQA